MTDAYIYDAVRTPRGKGKGGALNEVTAVALSARTLDELAAVEGMRQWKIEVAGAKQILHPDACLARNTVDT